MEHKIQPLITVVTVSYNAAATIEETILSVVNQAYENIEYIIIDGGSTDGTVEIIKRYADRIAYWVSEPDKGIYDAMNKGIKAATGEWINFMNAGDRFANENVVKMVCTHLDDNEIDVIYGDVIKLYKFGERVVKAAQLNKIRQSMVFSHQSVFVKTNIIKCGFDTDFKYAADYNMLLSFYMSHKHFEYYPIAFSKCIIDEGLTARNFQKSKKEVIKIHKQYHNKIKCYHYFFREIIHFYIVRTICFLFPSLLKKIYTNNK